MQNKTMQRHGVLISHTLLDSVMQHHQAITTSEFRQGSPSCIPKRTPEMFDGCDRCQPLRLIRPTFTTGTRSLVCRADNVRRLFVFPENLKDADHSRTDTFIPLLPAKSQLGTKLQAPIHVELAPPLNIAFPGCEWLVAGAQLTQSESSTP